MARPPWVASLKPTHVLVVHGSSRSKNSLVLNTLAAMSRRGPAAAAAAVEESLPPDLRGIALANARGLVIVQLVSGREIWGRLWESGRPLMALKREAGAKPPAQTPKTYQDFRPDVPRCRRPLTSRCAGYLKAVWSRPDPLVAVSIRRPHRSGSKPASFSRGLHG